MSVCAVYPVFFWEIISDDEFLIIVDLKKIEAQEVKKLFNWFSVGKALRFTNYAHNWTRLIRKRKIVEEGSCEVSHGWETMG